MSSEYVTVTARDLIRQPIVVRTWQERNVPSQALDVVQSRVGASEGKVPEHIHQVVWLYNSAPTVDHFGVHVIGVLEGSVTVLDDAGFAVAAAVSEMMVSCYKNSHSSVSIM